MIREVIANKDQANNQRKNKVTVYSCEEILGTMKSVKDFAAFYVTHEKDLEVAKTYFLIQYCENMLFTPEQLNAYKMGLDTLFTLFQSAELDNESYVLQAQKVNKGSVG